MSFAMMITMRRINSSLVIIPCLLLSWFFCVGISQAADTLRAGEVMRDKEFLESSARRFQLLFFNLDSPSTRYLGIQYMYYKDDKPVVWVANPENPLMDTSGVLNITQHGNLVITDDRGTSIIVNSEQPANSSDTSVTLLDSGNLILRAGEKIVWQSFDYLSHVFLPGMKLGIFDLNTGRPRNQFLTSWLSPHVPAPGAFTLGIDPNNTKQLVLWRRGVPYWCSGIWNGYNFSHLPDLDVNKFNFEYFSNENESYFTFTDESLSPWIGMDSFGKINQVVATEKGMANWSQIVSCDDDKVETRSKGCVTPEPSRCRRAYVFSLIMGITDGWESLGNLSLGLSDCREICVRNCSCNAYASMHLDGRGCRFSRGQKVDRPAWEKELIYVRDNTDGSQKNKTTVVEKDHPRKTWLWLVVGASVVSQIILTLVSILCYLRWKGYCYGGKNGSSKEGISQDTELSMYNAGSRIAAIDELGGAFKPELSGKEGHELPLFSFPSIEIATNHFSDENKLGQGGFGYVYKGKLVEGQEIAVKRLSKSSRQGLEEFKNEVVLISKLQHRNLVGLLGYCIQGEERILIYELLPNKSLDLFLSDATKRALLDWKKRLCIIEGIAQGLLYLHKYSRLKIIHRDLKISNILLDSDMNPKISDFGTARIFKGNEYQVNTNRIVGTYGYMSPEYAMDGLFSVKSDVFNFGVMMLEIISGKRNTSFHQSNRFLNLLGYAWNLYRERKCLELMDPAIEGTCSTNEVMRCVQIGLLCVQESAVDRPTMSDVVSMLSNESMTLPAPKQPAFSIIASGNDTNLPENPTPFSVNDVTVSEIVAR